jgi:transposase-like protein
MGRNRDPRRHELVSHWKRSGLSAREFAARVGINPRTLERWSYELGRRARGERETALATIVEVRGTSSVDQRFEVELSGGRRVRVPSSFDAEALRRLVTALEVGA